ncbi:hypothetical protein OWV82_020189 [Melia azedarach]|uniref:Uncharacterized protein n=1 Tax=Melia azedarach TaxID=155640 RepID=A0ACC1X5J6_MELAZ|nr:hypothetical protein OWV82_020189 [Melia azedarach]
MLVDKDMKRTMTKLSLFLVTDGSNKWEASQKLKQPDPEPMNAPLQTDTLILPTILHFWFKQWSTLDQGDTDIPKQ